MAEINEQVVVEIKIDQGQAATEAAKLKRELVEIKQEQANLNKQFKDGKVSLDQYAKSSSELDQRLKSTQSAYGNITKSITGTKSKMDELIKSNQQLASSVKVQGTVVGDLGNKIAGLANPYTAAIAAGGALLTLYGSSTIGAKDLAFAQGQLGTAVNLLANDFAGLVSSAEDGQGILSKLTNSVISYFSPATGAISRYIQMTREELEDLQRDEINVRGDIQERLETNAELQTKITDEATRYEDKLRLQEQVIENLKQNQADIVAIKTAELAKVEQLLAADKENEDLQQQRNQAEKDLNRERARTERQIQSAERALQGIIKANDKRIEQEQMITSEIERQARIAKLAREQSPTKEKSVSDLEIEGQIKQIELTHQFADAQEYLAKKTDKLGKVKEQTKKITDSERLSMLSLSQGLGVFMGALDQSTAAYQIIASSRAFIDTYGAATAALAPPPEGLGPVFGPFLAAATIAAGLANIAKINGAFAEGGWTGSGSKYDVAGVVHADEYVVPKRLVNDNYAQPHIAALEAMRTRQYAEGGIVTQMPKLPNIPEIIVQADIGEIVREGTRYSRKMNITQR